MKTGTLLIVGALVAFVVVRQRQRGAAPAGAPEVSKPASAALGADSRVLSAPVTPAQASPPAIGYARPSIDRVDPDGGIILW